ncbi:unnamed protein product [Meganyctiphanes norvegica]|uniref:SHSP domain-containing protein n=1 Tax=Meganyctiphanes norvegica TaxID=48144 RepID=A0AAV2RJN8_MEGNR
MVGKLRNYETSSNILYSHNPNEYYVDGEAKNQENFTVVPIEDGGPFYKDQYFEGYRLQFEHCVKEILQKFSISTRSGDIVGAYHRFRDEQLMETNQAMSHITDQANHQIVVDVRDFIPGNIIVKSYHNMIQVEGDVVKNYGDYTQPKKFHRQFIIPGFYEISSVVAVISSEGVLAIVVPRTFPKDNTRVGHQKYQYADDVPQRRDSTDYVRRMSKSPSPQPQSPPRTPQSSGSRPSASQDRTPNVREIKINTPQSSDSGRGSASTTPSRRGSIGDGATYVSPKYTYRRNAHGGFWRDRN